MTTRPAVFLPFLALFLLGGCSLFEANVPGDTLPASFTDAQTRWNAGQPERYEFGYEGIEDSVDYLILVERGAVTRVRLRDTGEAADLSLGVTIDDLFDRLEAAHLSGAYLIEADYALIKAYPRHVRIDPDQEVEDDETGWTVLSLRALLPCSGC